MRLYRHQYARSGLDTAWQEFPFMQNTLRHAMDHAFAPAFENSIMSRLYLLVSLPALHKSNLVVNRALPRIVQALAVR